MNEGLVAKNVRTAETTNLPEWCGYPVMIVAGDNGHVVVGVPRSLVGKAVRVTVDEMVRPCCSEWRGLSPLTIGTRDGLLKREIKFCPECGREL